jgi:glucose/mannose-6-phosphate isomerase
LLVLTKALLALLGEQALIEELNVSADTTGDVSGQAVTLADALTDRIPVIYASTTNEVLAYIMKIMMNETGKTPAFSNVFPEINHNEMQGFDVSAATAALASSCSLVLLRDSADHERIQKRMDVFENLMRERGVQVHSVSLPSASRCHQLVWTWLLARETGYLLAERYGVPADETPLITDFKRNL